MKPEPEMSDQEIRSYMDFDGLLAKQKQAASSNGVVKWSFALLLIIGAGVSVVWYVYVQPKPVENKTEMPVVDGPAEVEQPVATTPQPIDESQAMATEHQQKEKTLSQSGSSKSEVKEKESDAPSSLPEPVYLQAEPVDGYSKLYDYFNSSLVYPVAALKDSVQGVSTVAFTINVEGKPENITVTQSLGTVFDQEAIRLIQQMPLWKPATLNGKPVPSKIALPLTFQIQKVNNPD